jgi:chromosome segregation ATPase
MVESKCEHALCNEKFGNSKNEVDEIKNNVQKLTDRVNEIDKKTDTLESVLTGKLNVIETKFDSNSENTKAKLELLEMKMDKYFTVSTTKVETKPVEDSFKIWVQGVGIKMLEYGVYGGVLYAVAKGLKLF